MTKLTIQIMGCNMIEDKNNLYDMRILYVESITNRFKHKYICNVLFTIKNKNNTKLYVYFFNEDIDSISVESFDYGVVETNIKRDDILLLNRFETHDEFIIKNIQEE